MTQEREKTAMDESQEQIWRPHETLPRDGTVIIARNADHPEWGSWAMLRRVHWVLDEDTGKRHMLEGGAWLHVCDHTSDVGSKDFTPFVPFSLAADDYNKDVRYEWQPFPSGKQKAAGVPSDDLLHWSDCAIYNEPAYPAGPCSCGLEDRMRARIAELETT